MLQGFEWYADLCVLQSTGVCPVVLFSCVCAQVCVIHLLRQLAMRGCVLPQIWVLSLLCHSMDGCTVTTISVQWCVYCTVCVNQRICACGSCQYLGRCPVQHLLGLYTGLVLQFRCQYTGVCAVSEVSFHWFIYCTYWVGKLCVLYLLFSPTGLGIVAYVSLHCIVLASVP